MHELDSAWLQRRGDGAGVDNDLLQTFSIQELTVPAGCRRCNRNQQCTEAVLALAFANTEHLGAAVWAYALGGWFAILHGNGLGILHFSLGATLHAICFHWCSPLN